MIQFKARNRQGEIFNSALSPFTFPAGEAHIKREDRRPLEETEIALLQFTPESLAQDLMHLAMWKNYLSGIDCKKAIVLPYAPGARADRGHPFGADVYAEFIADGFVNQIILFDPHSPVIVEKLKFHSYPETEIVVVTSDEILYGSDLQHYTGIIAPDKGAAVRAGAVAEKFRLPLYTVSKTRDFETGKLKGFDTSEIAIPEWYDHYLIVDDICDGGGTFKGIAKATGIAREQLSLFVSHGVFSGDAQFTLPDFFDKIITTTSYAPLRLLPSAFSRINSTTPLLRKVK